MNEDAHTSDRPILSVRDLSVEFPLRHALLHAVKSVSFDLWRGRTLGIVGESGSGKSVTARALLQIVDTPGRITSGSILLESGKGVVDIGRLRPGGPQIRSIRGGRIGLVFQEPMSALSPLHTIGNQIDEALQIHLRLEKKEARKETIELLRQVEIKDPERMADRYSFEYSGGMRQRVCIAMALACNPDVLIADEPTTALDVTTQAEIMDLIKRLQDRRGMAMLLITHDLGLVAEVADEIVVMRHGEIVEHGDVDQLFHAPRHRYSRHLLDASVRLESPKGQGNAEPQSRPPILSVRNLSKGFGVTKGWFGTSQPAFMAVDDVSFDLRHGENLGIVGESGSGKTTLGRAILRIVEPTSGEVIYRDDRGVEHDIRSFGKAELRRYHAAVRLVFQDPFASLNPRMTVKQIIGSPLKINRAASGKALDRRVAELLEMVGLSPAMMDRYPHAFSGGQRQRIGIARALALDPRIIIADEATSALDVSVRSQVLDLMLDLQSRLDLSFIFISHDISVVRYFCDRVAVMHRGRVVEIGAAEKICTDPDMPYTKALISAVPNPDPRNKRMLKRVRVADLEANAAT